MTIEKCPFMLATVVAHYLAGSPCLGQVPSAPRQPPPTSCVAAAADDSTVYDTTQVSEKPVLRAVSIPKYPEAAQKAGVGGRILVSGVVGVAGQIEDSSIVVLEPVDERLDAEAVRTLRSTFYWPGCREGRAVRVRVVVPVEFWPTRRRAT